MRLLLICLLAAGPAAASAPPVTAAAAAAAFPSTTDGLSGSTVLIIRHAEKPLRGRDLTTLGQARADAYPRFFQGFRIDGTAVHIDALIAAADSRRSDRSRLTLEPLGHALGLPVDQPFKSKQAGRLVDWLRHGQPRRIVLIAWHHGDIPRLLAAFGQSPDALLRHGRWPAGAYNRVIVLRFDKAGALIPDASRIVKEKIDRST